MSDGIEIATLPAGTLIIRRATIADMRQDFLRVLLVQKPGQQPEWITWPELNMPSVTITVRA